MREPLVGIDRIRRDQAITACCLAAAAVGDSDLPAARRGRLLMDCLGALIAAHRMGRGPSMAQFRSGLGRPVRHLLPDDLPAGRIGDVVLLDSAGQLSDEARDLCVEHLVPSAAVDEHWSWARVSAEQEERRVYETLRRLREKDYTRARGLLVKVPAGELGSLRRRWDGLLGQLGLYEPISGWTWCQLRGYWFACPVCRWPMRVRAGAVWDVRCEAHARDGVIYTCAVGEQAGRVPKLQPAGARAAAVRAMPATADHYAVSRTVWRYMTLPGLLECELRDYARSLKATVTMWPHKDRYDLRISLHRKVWKVDAKAWVSAVKLGDALRETEPAEPGLIIVIPEHQHGSRELLQHMIGRQGYRVLTASGLKAELDKADVARR